MRDEHPLRMSDELPEDPGQIRRMGEEFLDRIVDFWRGTADRPVHPGSSPADFEALHRIGIPARGRPLDEILDDLARHVLPGLTQVASPRYLGMMNPPPALAAVFAESLTAALNQNCALWHQSPAGAELEKSVLRWFLQLAGLAPESAFGILVNGGSMANITALKLARDRAAGPGVRAARGPRPASPAPSTSPRRAITPSRRAWTWSAWAPTPSGGSRWTGSSGSRSPGSAR